MKTFLNPANNYRETDGGQLGMLWCLLFGPLYFLVRGNGTWFLLSLILVFVTYGISLLLVPLFAREINRKHLLRKGYIECLN
jgi:hypothetical protein